MLAALTLLLVPLAALHAQAPDSGGVLIRIGGDATVAEGTRVGALVVVDGTATVEGSAELVVVVRGHALLRGADIGHVFAGASDVRLEDGATVREDVELVRSTLTQEEGTEVLGRVRSGVERQAMTGAWFFGLFVVLGMAALALVAGLLLAGLAPEGVRSVGTTLVGNLKATLVATALVWLVLPILGVAVMPTVVGLPAGLGVFLVVLPALGFVGYLLAGTALGEAILHAVDRRTGTRPFAGAALGIAVLLVAALIPIFGQFVAPLAGALGSGAWVVTLWRRWQGQNQTYAEPEVAI